MTSAKSMDYSSAAPEVCSFFNPPHTRRVAPLCSELTNRSQGDGCAYFSTSIWCNSLGLSSLNSIKSPPSPSSKACPSDSPRYGLKTRTEGDLFADHPTEDTPEQDVGSAITAGKGLTVFVWDMDETLIIFQALLDGRYVELFDGFKDCHKATHLGRRWEHLILEVCDEYFFYQRVEEYNYPNLDSLQEYDDGIDLDDYKFGEISLTSPLGADNLRKLRYLHRYIIQRYEQGLETLLSPEQAKKWNDLYEETDAYTDSWLSSGRQKLEEFQRASEQALQDAFRSTTLNDGSSESAAELVVVPPYSYNYLVTSGTLIPSLVKCLLFKLNPYFHPSSIFSSREVGKLQCFRWIRERNQDSDGSAKFCVIGDGPDEKEAARVLAWPFVKVSIDPSVSEQQLPRLSFKTIQKHIETVYRDSDAS